MIADGKTVPLVLVVLEFTDTKKKQEDGWRECGPPLVSVLALKGFFFFNLAYIDLLKEITQSVMGPALHQTNLSN